MSNRCMKEEDIPSPSQKMRSMMVLTTSQLPQDGQELTNTLNQNLSWSLTKTINKDIGAYSPFYN